MFKKSIVKNAISKESKDFIQNVIKDKPKITTNELQELFIKSFNDKISKRTIQRYRKQVIKSLPSDYLTPETIRPEIVEVKPIENKTVNETLQTTECKCGRTFKLQSNQIMSITCIQCGMHFDRKNRRWIDLKTNASY